MEKTKGSSKMGMNIKTVRNALKENKYISYFKKK